MFTPSDVIWKQEETILRSRKYRQPDIPEKALRNLISIKMQHYRNNMQTILGNLSWQITETIFGNEMFFVLRKINET